jgi:butyryl-CoA dehydrogenase/short/branched chain acyl-CoA dehydrogenase
MTTPLTLLTEEEEQFRLSVRKYARERVAPHVREMDEQGRLRPELLKEFFELGWMGIEVPEEYSGAGGTFFESILAVEELAGVEPGLSLIVDIQNTLMVNIVRRWGNDWQKQRWLPRMASDTLTAFAVSEAGSGSDAFAMASTAIQSDGHYLLQGRKLWCSNALEAGLFLIFANARPEAGYKGITAFMVERGAPGLTLGRKEDKMGMRSTSTCELILDVKVPRTHVLGEVGEGYKIAIESLNEGRIGIAAQMTGLAQAAYEHALAYAKQRKQFGKAIAEFQGVQFELARMATQIEAARLLTYNAARLKMAGKPFVKESSFAKLFASETAERVSSAAIEIFGGIGFTKDCPVEKLYRDAKIGKIYEGTVNIQLQTIARTLLK